jgi:hypothetical protein
MFSQEVWAIDELVRLICYHTLEYKVQGVWNDTDAHDGLVLKPRLRRTLARCVVYLNHFISRIAVECLWRELSSLEPLRALLPLDYCRKVELHGSVYVSYLCCCIH